MEPFVGHVKTNTAVALLKCSKFHEFSPFGPTPLIEGLLPHATVPQRPLAELKAHGRKRRRVKVKGQLTTPGTFIGGAAIPVLP